MSIKKTVSPGMGTELGVSGKGSLLRTSAFEFSLPGL